MTNAVQQRLRFRGENWGGKRKGAGRKPKFERAGVAHRRREKVTRHLPVHVTMKLRKGLPSLRRRRESRALFGVFGKVCEGAGFRVTHFSIQGNHLHLIVEADDAVALSRGMQGLAIRIAKGLNPDYA